MRFIVSVAAMSLTFGTLTMPGRSPRVSTPSRQSILSSRPAGCPIASIREPDGPIKDQIKRVMDRIDAKLQASGSRLSNAVSVMVSLKNQSDFAAMNEVYRAYLTDAPPARTTVIAPLTGDALIEMSVTAVSDGVERTAVNPAGWLTTNPYSYGIKTGDVLFMSGLISRNGQDNTPIKGDIHTQTWMIMQNAAMVLDAAGMTFTNVVSSRIYIVDPAATDEMYGIYRGYLPGAPPPSTTATALLTSADYLVEVTMIASKARPAAKLTPITRH